MASQLRVDEIIASTGSSVAIGTAGGSVTLAGDFTVDTSKGLNVGTGATIFSPSSNVLTLGTNNAERVRIDSSGRFGIGTNTLSRDLVLYKASAPAFHIQNSTSGTGSFDGLGIQLVGADAGLWNYENGYLRFGTNDLERLRITSSGNVAVNDTGNAGYTSFSPCIALGDSGDSQPALVIRGSATSVGDISFCDNSGTESEDGVSEGLIRYDHNTDHMEFHTADSERLRITSSGNVGINSTSPAYLLDIASSNASMRLNSTSTSTLVITSGASNSARIEFGDVANNDTGYIYYNNSDDSMRFATNGSNERLRITSSGDVGLKLTNNSNVKYGLTLAQGSTDSYKLGWADGGGTKRGAIWVNSSNDAMEFMTGSADAQRMRIRSDGRFELTTNGTYLSATSVDYYVNAGTSRTYGFYVHKNGTGTYGSYTYLLGGNSTQYAVGGQVDTNSAYSSGGGLFYSINSNTYGIVGYWSTSAYYTLYGNGVALATGGHTTSDARLKDVQSGIGTGILDKVCSLEAKKYTWKENSQQRRSVGGGTQIGLLAQDVQEHFPEVVMEHENPQIAGHNPETLNEQIGTTYSVEYGKLTAVLIEAIKELRSENNALAERITALEG